MLQKAIVSTVGFCVHYAAQIIVLALLLCLGTGFYAATHFAVDADVNKLISTDLPWRQREATIESLFPSKHEMILVVLDAPTSTRIAGQCRTRCKALRAKGSVP